MGHLYKGTPTELCKNPKQAPKQQDWQLRLDNNNFASWQRQQHSYFLFFDGAATGNPGVAGAGGVIYDSEGKKLIDYAWGLGRTSNNKAELLAAYMGLKLAQDLRIQALTVLGDSEIVIKDLRGMPRSTKAPPQSISAAINSFKKNFVRLSFYHILRKQNTEADKMAKAAKTLEQSSLCTNQTLSNVWLP
jgi:ribonuclease HI